MDRIGGNEYDPLTIISLFILSILPILFFAQCSLWYSLFPVFFHFHLIFTSSISFEELVQ